MAITTANSINEPRAYSEGGSIREQILTWSAVSGATSGTVTADSLTTIKHIMVLGGRLRHSAAPTFSGNVATLAFTVPAETAASRTLQSALTFTAVANLGATGNNITYTFTGGATQGNEVVTVLGTAITIQVESGVSTATDVKTAYDLVAAAVALATLAIPGGHETDTIATATVLPLQNGVTGGGRGTIICLGV